MRNDKRTPAEVLQDAQSDYLFDSSIMCDENEKFHKCKEIIAQKLSEADRMIILLYTELQSFRKLGAMLGVSHTIARKEVQRIRDEIKKYFK